jgi:hypothetical protein
MGGRSISGYVSESVAEKVSQIAAVEERSPANVVGQAVNFYVGLPETSRTALRRMAALSLPEERAWLQVEMVRLLLKAEKRMLERRMAQDIGERLPADASEDAIGEEAVRWANGA